MIPKLILISTTMLLIFLATPCASNLGQIPPTSEVLPPEIDNISSDEPIQEKLPIEGATSTATPLPYPQAVKEVVKMFRATCSFSPVDVQVISYQDVEWGDSCLGLAAEGEMCAEVITSGWIVVLQAEPGGKAIFHTDQTGSFMRRAPDTEIPTEKFLMHPKATRTGIENLDLTIEAILSNRVEDRREIVHYTELACTTSDSLGGPPKCQPGEADGNLLEVLPILGPEGYHARRESIDQALSFTVEGLYAIYQVSKDAWVDENYPVGEYGVVVILSDNPFPMTVQVKEAGIVRLDYHLGKTPIEVIKESGPELLLPPLTKERN